ncbi:MAG TPA: TetR/AcrR family transcriptional regulator [Vicinamibacteria bacterium]|nr:TetR/AcrR family transcriptional regulator [Vicinamibacteria bacterium]
MESRRERKKQQTRTALLEAAMALFAEGGVSGTRVEDITERVDLGKGAFYNYFASKDALIADLVARGVDTFEQGYLSQLDTDESAARRVAHVVRLHDTFLGDHPQYALLFHQARGLLLLQNTRVEKLRVVFAHYLRRVGQALGTGAIDSCSDEDMLDIAAALVGGVSGYRSFRIAAALPANDTTAEQMLTPGILGLLAQRGSAHGR